MLEKHLLSADGMLLNEAEDRLLTFRLAFCLSWIVSAHIPCLLLLLSPAAQLLVDGLKLVCPAEGDELYDLVREAYLRRRAGTERIFRCAVAAQEHFVVDDLPHTDVYFALLRKDHCGAGQTVGTDGRDDDALGLRVQDRPAGRQRIGCRACGGRHDDAVTTVTLYKDVVAVDAEVDGLLQAAFRHDHIMRA